MADPGRLVTAPARRAKREDMTVSRRVSALTISPQLFPVAPDAAAFAVETVEIEARALEGLARVLRTTALGKAFAEVTSAIIAAKGRVIVSGMGKSGLMGRKIASTLASTGTPAFYIHPADAGHGDLGMITADDIVLVLSWSGETEELSDIVTYCRRFAVPMIAITANAASTLATKCDYNLTLPEVEEACPNRLAPTSSTTMQGALGDALAVALMKLRNFSSDDFLMFHPRGKLASKLVTVANIMATGDDVPCVGEGATILEATVEMTGKRFGSTAVVDADGRLIGAFTDGDLRRSIARDGIEGGVAEHMSLAPLKVQPGVLASEALAIMNRHSISQLFVCEGEQLAGIVHLHDALRAGVA